MTLTKRCCVCGEIKPINEFYTAAGGKRYCGRCKLCKKSGRKAAATKIQECATCGREIVVHYRAKLDTNCPECRQVRAREYKRKPAPIENICGHCGYLQECRANIWDIRFDPPCFRSEAIVIPVQVEAQYL